LKSHSTTVGKFGSKVIFVVVTTVLGGFILFAFNLIFVFFFFDLDALLIGFRLKPKSLAISKETIRPTNVLMTRIAMTAVPVLTALTNLS